MESEPVYELTINGEPFEGNRKNLTLFTYMGRSVIEGVEVDNSSYDHVFITVTPEPMSGAYVFAETQEAIYKKLASFIRDNNMVMILNRDEVPECDRDAWNVQMFGDLNSSPEWLNENS